jgi:hypothetical protein
MNAWTFALPVDCVTPDSDDEDCLLLMLLCTTIVVEDIVHQQMSDPTQMLES